MAQIKLLKISTDGIPVENAAADDITLNSFTAGAGPVVSPTGVNMTNTSISALANVTFTDPSVNTINQTVGTLVVNNIVGKDRSNVLTTAADILFPVITDLPGMVDSFRLPQLSGPPTSTPTTAGQGYQVWDQTNGDLYIYNGTSWVNQSLTKTAMAIDDTYTVGATVAKNDVVFVSAADAVSPASAANASNYAVSTTIPVGSGNTIVLCGIAKNTTSMQIKIEELGRRA
jgi:hypothetical protein